MEENIMQLQQQAEQISDQMEQDSLRYVRALIVEEE